MDNISECKARLSKNGYTTLQFNDLDPIKSLVINKNYLELDHYFQKETSQSGELFKLMKLFCPVAKIEFIISLRESDNDWEEDGIWHDDGSRIMAFSLSLTEKPPQGGKLGFRKKGNTETAMIATPPLGEMIIFKTGLEGYEHKIHAVTKGTRLVIAGWCYAKL